MGDCDDIILTTKGLSGVIMSQAAAKLDEAFLALLAPLNSLASDQLYAVMECSKVERLPPGRRLFTVGDSDNRTIYLLSGQLALMAEGSCVITLKSDSSEATQPVANQQPRQMTALASTSVTILSIDSDILNKILDNTRQVGNDQISKESGVSPDTKRVLNEIPLFGSLTIPYQQVLLKRFTEYKYRAGDVVVHEDDAASYFYLIIEGRCQVHSAAGVMQMRVPVELSVGNGFGADALLSDDGYSGTVTMLDDGVVLRLHKGEFLTLIVKPLVNEVDNIQLKTVMCEGARLLDIRTPTAFRRRHRYESINLPLVILQKVIAVLDPALHYIICGNTRRRCAMAAYLFAEKGIRVNVYSGE